MRHIRSCSLAAVAAAVVTGVTGGPAAATGPGPAQVACSTTALTTAIATASSGATLSLARNCAYHLTSAFAGGDGLPPVTRNLTIQGNGSTIVRDGATAGTFRIFHVTPTGNLRLEDLTVRGGNAPGDGGGVLVDGGGRLTLYRVDVVDNTATASGGGVAVAANATAVVRTSWVAFNNARDGGGLHTLGALSVEDSELARNHARGFGGAIDQAGGGSFVRNSVIRRNTSAAAGGGVAITGGTAEITDSKITNNTNTGTAGGGVENRARLTLVRTEVSGNVVGGSAGVGGGIHNATVNGVLALRDSQVIGNGANGDGASRGGGIYNAGGQVTLDDSTVRGNASTVAPGGIWTDTQFTVANSKIIFNIPTNCTGSPVVVPGCVG
ncbi:hypothetical protein ACGFT2_11385 [Streptomyces sp. NPDC048514]|uniref:hypothetical protein n=1 Tax=Streptomyces sp. NPDC048514 TaxID=3365564 RepID=UPI0037211D51